MSRVDFYLDAGDRFAVAARLAQKGFAAGLRLLVTVPDAESGQRFDRTLWTFAPQSFVPHAQENSPLATASPVVIAQKIPDNATSQFGALINLTPTLPVGAESFARVIEIVGLDEDDKNLARQRFKAYRDLGCEMFTHKLGQGE